MNRRAFFEKFVLVLAGLGACLNVQVVAAPSAVEQARIEKLIRHVEVQKDVKFIRNGSEYGCDEAAKFLRRKLESMGQEVATAREFIDRIASKSSTSGKPYQIRYPDGRLVPVATFLSEELKRIESLPA